MESKYDSEVLLDEWHGQMDELGRMLIEVKRELVQLRQENQILRECLQDSYAIINACDR